MLWNDFYRLTTTPPAPAAPPLRSDAPYYVLVESLGQDQREEQKRMQGLLDKAKEMGLFTEAVTAQSSAQRAALWKVREDTQQIEGQYGENFGFDVSLPVNRMAGYVEQFRQDLHAAFGPLKVWIFGHLADGNLHIHVWGEQIDMRNDADRVENIIYRPLQALGGSISAEHGIGLRKKPYLALSRTPEEIAVMRQIKATLDRGEILNPGKVFDAAGGVSRLKNKFGQ